MKRLSEVDEGVIKSIDLSKAKTLKLMHLGLVKDAKIKKVFVSPFNDPIAYQINGCVFAIRLCDAKKIWVK